MDKNYYIGAMSLIDRNKINTDGSVKKPHSVTENGMHYDGFQTNEIPTEYFIDLLMKDSSPDSIKMFDKFIFFDTKECEENKFYIKIGDQKKEKISTEEYFRKWLAYYLENKKGYKDKKVITNEEEYKDVKEYCEKAIVYEKFNDDKNEDMRTKIEKIIVDYFDQKDNINLYFDFTGGSRHVEMIILLFVRVLEGYSSNVKEIVYTDITGSSERLISLKKDYELMKLIELKERSLAEFAKTHDKLLDMGSTKELSNYVKRDDYIQKLTRFIVPDRSEIESAEKDERHYETSDPMNIAELLSRKKMGRVIRVAKGKNPIKKFKLWENNSKTLIKNFYEMAVDAILDLGVFMDKTGKISKKNVKNNIKCYFNYYFGNSNELVDQNDEDGKYYGVVERFEEMVDFLTSNPDVEPWHYWAEMKDNHTYEYWTTNYKYPKKVKTDLSNKLADEYVELCSSISDHIIQYEKEQGNTGALYEALIKLKNHIDEIDSDKNTIAKKISDFCRYQMFCCNVGFPFECIDQNNGCFHRDIVRKYKEEFDTLFREIQTAYIEFKKEKDNKGYEKYKAYLAAISLPNRIPIVYTSEQNQMKIDEKCSFFTVNKINPTDFINELIELLNQIRIPRNVIIHTDNEKYHFTEEDYRSYAKKIMVWINKYSICVDEMNKRLNQRKEAERQIEL